MSMMIIRSRMRAYLAGACYIFARFCLPHLSRRFHGKTRVIVFHHVDEEMHFAKIIAALQKRYNIISFEDYVKGRKSSSQLNIIIALDDGYHSWFTKARSTFKKFAVRPLLFVSADFIACDEAAAQAFCRTNIKTWSESSLSWDELKTLSQEGAEIGGHACGHVNLTTIKDDKQLLDVVQTDRMVLEEKGGVAVRSFSYPFGLYNAGIADKISKAGYSYAFTSDSGLLEDSKSPFLLKRTNIGQRPPLVVEAFVEGWADWISAVVAWVKRRKVS